MPKPIKQTPRPTTTGRRTQTSSANREATETDPWAFNDAVHMLVYGESGSGKTTFWSSFPGPILCIICSGSDRPGELKSINTAEMRGKVTPRLVRTTTEVRQHLADAGDYATVVLDHGSGLADLTLKEILGLRELPPQLSWGLATQQQYGEQALKLKEFFRALLNLPQHVVIVAQQRTFGGDDNNSDVIKPTVAAALSPSVTGWLNPACDYVVQTFKRPFIVSTERTVGGKSIITTERGRNPKTGLTVEYCLRTEPHEVFMTKFRVPKGHALPDSIVDPTFAKVQSVINGEEMPDD